MRELVAWANQTDEADLRTLVDALRTTVPDLDDVVVDQWRALAASATHRARAAYEQWEVEEPPRETRAPSVADAVVLVVPVVTSAVVSATVDVAIAWLRGLVAKPRTAKDVVIFGPDGEPLRKVRLRPGSAEPEVHAELPWPAPEYE